MFRLRLAILGATAALALGTATGLAMTATTVSGDRDNHGSVVSAAAHTCPQGADGAHGDCVSAVASTNGQSHRDGQQSARVQACLAARTTHDRAAQEAFKACVKATTPPATKGS
jgi:hypothetical protein